MVALAATTVALEVSNGSPTSSRSAAVSHPSTTPPPTTTPPVSSTPSTTTPASTPTTSPSSGSSPATGIPTLSTLDPAQGSAGQQITVDGSDLFSTDGVILAHFDGAAAPISCPTMSTCTVTVPAAPASATRVLVTVVTQAGSSNGLWFTYQ